MWRVPCNLVSLTLNENAGLIDAHHRDWDSAAGCGSISEAHDATQELLAHGDSVSAS